ncbi:MAG: 50S ribosomal protein L9 [Rickettsiales bacterium]|jgi:large subunit ribosomal protein L9|nr:50S ribosomal protein L9 [Rickettsiales bacterium]
MKIILTAKIKTLGDVGDIRVVADGYGRNYLIPQKLAIVYSDYNYRFFEERRRLLAESDTQDRARAEEVRTKIEERNDLTMALNAGENNRLYGSVTPRNIADFLNGLLGGKYLERNNLSLQRPIKTLGKFTIAFHLHPDVHFERELSIVRGDAGVGE